MKIGILDQKNGEYDPKEMARHRALYAGGKAVRVLLDELLYKGQNEADQRFQARKDRAYYVNHCASIVDQLVAWLFSAQPRVASDPADPDEFWKDFIGNCDLGGHSLHQFQQERLREAFITRRAWTLVELPTRDAAQQQPSSLADEDRAGMRRAYLVALPTESVIDWEYDEDGELLWATVKNESRPRPDPSQPRGLRVVTWTIYDRQRWTRYEWRQKKPGVTWTDKEDAKEIGSGLHTFDRVPLDELCLPEGFYLLGKVADHLVESFNARNAKSWGMYTGLFAMPVHKKVQSADGSDTSINRSYFGNGYGIEIGHDEDLYLLEPSGASFTTAKEHIAELKDELYRVVHQMALSADNSAGAMKRSGDSKAQDKESSEIVLQALSQIEAPNREAKLNLVAAGRKDKVEWDVTPVEKFSLQSAGEVIQDCTLAGAAGVRSKTFEKERQKKLAAALLPDLEEEKAKQIDEEIDENVEADPDAGMGLVAGGLEPPERPAGGQGPADNAGGEPAAGAAKAQRKMGGMDGGRPQRRPSGGGRRSPANAP
jgi:hypothetical protein